MCLFGAKLACERFHVRTDQVFGITSNKMQGLLFYNTEVRCCCLFVCSYYFLFSHSG